MLTTDREGFVSLSACKREILANFLARVLEPFKKGEIVRRGARDKQVSGLQRARFRAVVQARTSSTGFTGTIRATRSMTFLFCSAFLRS